MAAPKWEAHGGLRPQPRQDSCEVSFNRVGEAVAPAPGTGAATSAQLRFFAQALVDFFETAAVLDALFSQSEGFLFLAGLEVGQN